MDFGCSELGFVTHLKNMPGIEEILCVDVDRDTLECHKDKTRSNPLTIHIFEGSVTHRDKKLENCNAVVTIELIKDFHPGPLLDFPRNIFGYIRPLITTVTSSIADFNMFPNMGNKFRRWDHKFEWMREQFEESHLRLGCIGIGFPQFPYACGRNAMVNAVQRGKSAAAASCEGY